MNIDLPRLLSVAEDVRRYGDPAGNHEPALAAGVVALVGRVTALESALVESCDIAASLPIDGKKLSPKETAPITARLAALRALVDLPPLTDTAAPPSGAPPVVEE